MLLECKARRAEDNEERDVLPRIDLMDSELRDTAYILRIQLSQPIFKKRVLYFQLYHLSSHDNRPDDQIPSKNGDNNFL